MILKNIIDICPGQIVYSKAGRDKARAYIVLSTEDEYAMLADGELRKRANPKKKKFKHIQPTNAVELDIDKLRDQDIKKICRDRDCPCL